MTKIIISGDSRNVNAISFGSVSVSWYGREYRSRYLRGEAS